MNSSVDSTILIEAGPIPKRSEGVHIFYKRKTDQVVASYSPLSNLSLFNFHFYKATIKTLTMQSTPHNLQNYSKVYSQTHTQAHINTLP